MKIVFVNETEELIIGNKLLAENRELGIENSSLKRNETQMKLASL